MNDAEQHRSTSMEVPVPPFDKLHEQVVRICASPGFVGSELLRNLLMFLAKASFEQPAHTLKEYEIATQVLGRQSGFDSRTDSAVRVHVGRLRAKLAEYYGGQGAADELIVEIPKGAYQLSVSHRPLPPAPITPGAPPDRNLFERWWMLGWLLAGAGVLVAMILIWAPPHVPQPAAGVRTFWSGFIRADPKPIVVFANPRFVSWAEGLRNAKDVATTPDRQVDVYTGTGELIAIHELTELFARLGSSFHLKRSQLLTWDDARNNDLILVGGPETNSVIAELPRLQRFRFKRWGDEPNPGASGIEDLQASAAGQRYYFNSGRPYAEDYAVVALVPGSTPDRRALLLAGTTTLGTQAAAESVLQEESLRKLHERLRMQPGAALPWFEALLKVRISGGVPVQHEFVVAYARR